MAYTTAPFLMTLSDLQGHSSISSVQQCQLTRFRLTERRAVPLL